MITPKLTEKQELFVREYLKDLNATQAAIRAGYSENYASEQAYQLLQKTTVQEAIAELKAERNKELKVDAKYVLNRLLDIDQLDVLDILDPNGCIKPVNEWPKSWRQNISSFEIAGDENQGQVVKLKFPDKVKNLELIGRHVEVGAWVTNQSIDLNANHKHEVSTLSDLIDELSNEQPSQT